MFCPNCGKEISDGANFCSHCGGSITSIPTFTPRNSPTTTRNVSDQMSWDTSISTCFSKFFVFNGRATRAEYWWFYLFTVLLTWGVILVDSTQVLSIVLNLILSVPVFAAGSRRLHDTNRSGWWQFLYLTIIGVIPVIVWMATKGNGQDNQYGSSVKGLFATSPDLSTAPLSLPVPATKKVSTQEPLGINIPARYQPVTRRYSDNDNHRAGGLWLSLLAFIVSLLAGIGSLEIYNNCSTLGSALVAKLIWGACVDKDTITGIYMVAGGSLLAGVISISGGLAGRGLAIAAVTISSLAAFIGFAVQSQ